MVIGMIDIKTSKMFRGIAILMVMISHYAWFVFNNPIHERLVLFITSWGVYGVDIFLVLSGYGLTKSAESKGIDGLFVLKRFVSVYLPYFFIVGFFNIVDKAFTCKEDVIRFIIAKDYWYLAVMFALYIMFMIFGKMGKYRDILLSVGVVAFSVFLWKRGMQDFWVLSNGAFLLGVYAASLEKKYGDKVEAFVKKSRFPIITIVMTLVFGFIFSKTGRMWAEVTRSLWFSLAALSLCICIKGRGVILPILGRFSLYIYLLHMWLFEKIAIFFKDWNSIASVFVTGVIILVISIALGFAMETNLNLWVKAVQNKKLQRKQMQNR